MANNYKYMLKRHRKEVEDSVLFDDVRDKLYSKSVLTDHDLDSLDQLDSNNLKVSSCLDIILARNDDHIFDNFVSSLSEMRVQSYTALVGVLKDAKGQEKMKWEEGTNAIIKGTIPRKYKNYVKREEETVLENLLKAQDSNEIITLIGFPLVGKSTLAAFVLQNPQLVFDCFKNKVFWVDLHDVTPDNHSLIADHLKRLIACVTDFDHSLDLQKEYSLASYTDFLRQKFLVNCKGGLLVLDNVCSKKIVRHFDIGCKLLLIVNNRNCMTDHPSREIQLNNFTENETISYFASALSVNARTLSENIPAARKIHHCLEGHPKLVSLVAAYLTERKADVWNVKRWEDLLSKLQGEGHVGGSRRSGHFGIIQKPLTHITEMLLKLLSDDKQKVPFQELFKKLVVLPEHVNITPDVLSVYWTMPDLFEVEDILNRFHELSLLERTDVRDQSGQVTFVYGLRNLILKCLISTVDDVFVISCHRAMLQAYWAKYPDLARLPNDNYIYNYYGYHLLKARMFDHFDVFVNLRFIGEKIRCCGVGAMLHDFRTYRKQITKNCKHLTDKLEAYVAFVKKCETNLLRNGLDLVQYALRITDNSRIVFNDAMEIAKASNKLYFIWTCKTEPHFTRTLDVHNRFETVLFGNDRKTILVGTSTGEIQKWDLKSRLMVSKYVGHLKGIKQLKLSPCKKFFLSVSNDKTMKIWRVTDGDLSDSCNGEPLSPSLRQRGHHSFFADEASVAAVGGHDTAITTTMAATFYGNTGRLISCTEGGMLVQWEFNQSAEVPLQLRGRITVAATAQNQPVFSLVCAGADFAYAYACADRQLYVLNPQLRDSYLANVTLPGSNQDSQDTICEILAVNDDFCVAISARIHLLRFAHVVLNGRTVLRGHELLALPQQQSDIGGPPSCATLTQDGAYLLTGTADGFVLLWDLQELTIVREFATNNCLVIGVDTFTSPGSVYVLLSGSDDSTIKCWHIPSDLQRAKQTRRYSSALVQKQQQQFACYWPPNPVEESANEKTIVAMLDAENNSIQVYYLSNLNTDQLLCTVDLRPVDSDAESTLSGVRLFHLDACALYYALNTGAVRRYDLHSQADDLLWFGGAGREVATLMCLGGGTIVVGCTRGSLHLIQAADTAQPHTTVLLHDDPTDCAPSQRSDIVRVFQLRQLKVRVRVLRLFVASARYTFVLCTETAAAGGVGGSGRSGGVGSGENGTAQCWVNSRYRLQDGGQENVTIQDCILSATESHLALFLSDGKCEVLRLEPNVADLSYISEYVFEPDPKKRVTCAAMSFDGKLLALGKENGEIEIVEVEKKLSSLTLTKHKMPIETLLFSPKPSNVLVSVSDQICWWKLPKSQSTPTSNPNRMSPLSLNVWDTKEAATPNDSSYLLSSVNLTGPIKQVTASKDFTSFLTLDSLGIMHRFNMIV